MTYYSKPNYSKHLHDWLKRGRNWHIEYDDYLSNHITHNWIALDAAGVSQNKMQWWQDVYINNVIDKGATSTAKGSEMLVPPRQNALDYTAITDVNWLYNIQSTRIAFEAYRDFFDKKIAKLGLNTCLKRYYPALSEGMAGAAMHPVIHTGWAVDVESDNMAAEGLAYMATAFQPLATGAHHSLYQLWSPDAPHPIDMLEQILADDSLSQLTKRAVQLSQTEDYKQLNRGGFQQRLITFDNPNEPMAQFLNDKVVLKLPETGNNLTNSIEALTVMAASIVYGSDNEFFIIHGLTSLHSVLCVLPHLNELAQRDALGYWFRALVATFIIQDRPNHKNTLAIIKRWQADKNTSNNHQLSDDDKAWWLQTLQATTDSLDEHVPKTVYVLKRWAEWQAFSKASHDIFATTALNIATPHKDGKLHENLWFSNSSS
ncbi:MULTISPECIES: questin oxidase family protein [unclassified Psychrobacter]|uniref:questin oxidase family protein n=3 Tax=Psychrobacter TaxID=497 RepID=UPI003F46DE8C